MDLGVRRTVVIVDDDDLSRRGMCAVLGDEPQIDVRAAMNHDEALAAPAGWQDVDVVIVDAADERRADDHFKGVTVVERVRARRSREVTTVVVITGHFFDDAVRVRMREAKADFFFHRMDLQDAARLRLAVLEPDRFRRGVPDPEDSEAVFRQGVTDASRVNEGVRFAEESGWLDGTLEEPVKRSRTTQHLRSAFNRKARLNPVTIDGRPPDRPQSEPSRPQIARFLGWATRAKGRR